LELINTLAQAYAERYSSPEGEALKQVSDQTYREHRYAHMICGHLQGKFLEMIARIAKPSKILEIGTFTGYSAICLANGLQPGGELHTIELRKPDALTAKENFIKSGVERKIRLHVGNALEVIPTLNHEWDIVFIDADKSNYIAYYQLVLPKVKKGGLIIADNVLFHGEVLEEEMKTKNATAIQAFNEFILKDESVEKIMLTLRDGLSLILKK
jgi:predicted O-methyltransferase YrrM